MQHYWNDSHAISVVKKGNNRSVTVALYSPGFDKSETSFLGAFIENLRHQISLAIYNTMVTQLHFRAKA